MTNSKVKILCLLLAIKRKKSNSKLLYKPKYILAKEFNLSPQTFSKYLKQCVSEGWIIEESDGWRAISLKKIFSQFHSQTGLFYGRHDILRGKSTDFYKIQDEFEQGLLISNIMRPQQRMAAMKGKLLSKNYRTVKESLRKFASMDPSSCADKIIDSMNPEVVTSARNVSKKLRVSVSKANKVLNSGTKVKREIRHLWVKGILPAKQDSLRREYPKATIILFPKYNAYKVCFGSCVTLC